MMMNSMSTLAGSGLGEGDYSGGGGAVGDPNSAYRETKDTTYNHLEE